MKKINELQLTHHIQEQNFPSVSFWAVTNPKIRLSIERYENNQKLTLCSSSLMTNSTWLSLGD